MLSKTKILNYLEELRWVILRSIITLGLVAPATFFVTPYIIQHLICHNATNNLSLIFLTPIAPFVVRVKLAILSAIFISMPYIAYNFWRFLTPALYHHERFYIFCFALGSCGLFILGAIIALYGAVPAVIKFSLSMATSQIKPVIGVTEFINLILWITLSFGVMFQLPLIIFFLLKTKLASLATIAKLRPLVAIAVLIVAAILTPPDIFSQLLLAIPCYLLFEITLLWGRLSGNKKNVPKK